MVVPDVGFERSRATIRLVSSRFCGFGRGQKSGPSPWRPRDRRGVQQFGSDRIVDATELPARCPNLPQLHSTRRLTSSSGEGDPNQFEPHFRVSVQSRVPPKVIANAARGFESLPLR